MSKEPKDRSIPPGTKDPKRRTITNKNTGETITFDTYGYESGGGESVATLVVKPGGGPPFHYHNSYAERFEPVQGVLKVRLGDRKEPVLLKPGDAQDVPAGLGHQFFNDGDVDIITRGRVIPSHAGFERSLYVLFGLNNDGFADPKTGLPRSMLQLALVSDMGDMRFPGVSGGLMNFAIKLLAGYARWCGMEEELLKKYWD